MSTIPRALAAVLLLTGCPSRQAAERATPDACQKTCKHIVELQQEATRASSRIRVHELEEQLERQEDEAKENVARLKQELTLPEPKFEDTLEAHRKVSSSVRAQLKSQFMRQVQDLKQNRLDGIAREQEGLKSSAALIATTRAKNEAELEKSFDDEIKKCQEDCVVTRTAKEVRCMQLAQAPDDITRCLPAVAEPEVEVVGAPAGKAASPAAPAAK